MTLFYNSNTGGFYDTDIHTAIPEGSVEITPAEHAALLDSQSKGHRIQAGRDGRPVSKAPVEPSLDEYKALARMSVETARAEEEAKGLEYLFPEDRLDTIQLRNVRDFLNIQAVVTRAQMLLASGVDVTIPFQAKSNTTHYLTPQQLVDMGLAVSDHSSQLYAKSWALKEAITSATTKAEVDQAKVWVNI